jgi:hypothetical protein
MKATKPFCGVEFAMRGAGLVGLERKREMYRKEEE